MEAFHQKSSITRKLTWSVTVISLLFVLDLAGTTLASRDLYREISLLYENRRLSNAALALHQITDSLIATPAAVAGNPPAVEIERVYSAIYAQALKRLDEAETLARGDPEAAAELQETRQNLSEMNEAFRRHFARGPAGENPDLTVGRQLGLEAGEALARLNLAADRKATASFEQIYRLRYRPLFVAMALTLLFIVTAAVGGRRMTEALRRSFAGLLAATREAAAGNLDARAPIVSHDELGVLAQAFNAMAGALRESTVSKAYVETQSRILAEVTDRISESLELRTTLANAVGAVVARMGDVGVIRIDASDETPATYEVQAKYPELAARVRAWLGRATPDDAAWPPGLTPRAQLHGPLLFRGHAIGAFTVASLDPARDYGEKEHTLFQELVRRIAIAIENSRLYVQARDAIASRDEFLSIASHELRTPLTSLLLRLRVLERTIKKGLSESNSSPQSGASDLSTALRQANASVAVCLDQGKRLTTLLDELLDLTRIRLGRLQLAREDLDLEPVVRAVALQYGPELAQKHISLSVQTEPVRGFWDPMRMEQVVSNLVSNAIKYGNGSPISVRLERDATGSKTRLSVADQGMGIPVGMREKIFERFERAITAERAISGFGLGLYICRQIVEAHGGTISVLSNGEHGSVFTVELPLSIPR